MFESARPNARPRPLSLAPALLLGCGLVCLPARAQADQFVLMDVEFTFTKHDADNSKPSPSHYYVTSDQLGSAQPKNWTAPVDYRNGTVHIRTEVIDKPAGGEVTQWSLCYIPNQGGYGCTHTGTYTSEGVYERDEAMTQWWQNDQIDWTQGIKEMHLVIKDSDGGSGHAHKRADHEKFFPTTVRITLVQVSAGATYDPSLVPGLGDATGSGGATGVGGAASGGGPVGGGQSAGGASQGSGGAPPMDTKDDGSAPQRAKSGGCAWQPVPSPLQGALGLPLSVLVGMGLARRRSVTARRSGSTGDDGCSPQRIRRRSTGSRP